MEHFKYNIRGKSEKKIQSLKKQLEANKLQLSWERENYEKALKEEREMHKSDLQEEMLRHAKKEEEMQRDLAETKKMLVEQQKKLEVNLTRYISCLKAFRRKHKQMVTQETQTEPELTQAFVSSTESEYDGKDCDVPDHSISRAWGEVAEEVKAAEENARRISLILAQEVERWMEGRTQQGEGKLREELRRQYEAVAEDMELTQETTPDMLEDLEKPSDDPEEGDGLISKSSSGTTSGSTSRSSDNSDRKSKTREGKTSDDEEHFAGGSILSSINSREQKYLAREWCTTKHDDMCSNSRGKKRKRKLFSDKQGPQLFAPVYDK